MTDLCKAAEMALEAMEDVQDMMTTSDWFNERVQAVRQALDQLPDTTKIIWVGLTDEEIREAFHPLHDTRLQFARAIEAKLKEKNT